MTAQRDPVAAVIAGSALLAVAAVTVPFAAQPRAAAVLWFLLAGPGLAVVRLLRPADPVAAAVLAGVVSIVADALVALAMARSGLWSPGAGVTLLALASLGSLALGRGRPV